MFRDKSRRGELFDRLHAAVASVDSYVIRVMCGLVLSLAVALVTVHLPLEDRFESVGWYLATDEERLTIDHLESRWQQPESEARPTRFGESKLVPDAIPETSEPRSGSSEQVQRTENPERLSGRRVFDYAHRMPEIVGGLGAYYIHIDYPESAIRQGIEGRLVLSFIVDTEGHTSEIKVVQSLHPACDSAAVQALRRTRFVPGSHDGEPVQVKMRLPVRFQLVPHASSERAEATG